jgi:glycosyl transferase family 25
MSHIKSLTDIKNAFYINLESRTDRKEHVETQLANIGVNAERFNAIKMENGAIGCSLSHLNILKNAEKNNLEHVLIVEDDITFLEPEMFKTQINKFFELHGNNWDVILLAGNNMPPYETTDDTCIKVSRCQTTTGYLVNGHYISKLLENIKMGLSYLIRKPDQGTIYAIDKFWFALQNVDRWYLIVPLSVVQKSDYSDIEKKQIDYSKLMLDLDKTELFKAIAKRRQQEQKQQQEMIKQEIQQMKQINGNLDKKDMIKSLMK